MSTNRKAAKTLGSSRVIHLYGEICEKTGREIINRLINLDKKSSKDILLIIDSPGGDIDTLVSIYQIIRLLRCEVGTLALSNANSAGAVLLACGKTGKRMVLPESIVMLHDMSTEFSNDYHKVLENEINSLRISKKVISQMLTEHGASSSIKLLKPEATYMLGGEAIKYGLADVVIKNFDDILRAVNI
jgi:ATP-dependent Clp protease protease subunit